MSARWQPAVKCGSDTPDSAQHHNQRRPSPKAWLLLGEKEHRRLCSLGKKEHNRVSSLCCIAVVLYLDNLHASIQLHTEHYRGRVSRCVVGRHRRDLSVEAIGGAGVPTAWTDVMTNPDDSTTCLCSIRLSC